MQSKSENLKRKIDADIVTRTKKLPDGQLLVLIEDKLSEIREV